MSKKHPKQPEYPAPKIDPALGKVVQTFALQECTHWSADTILLTPVILATLKQFKAAERMGTPMEYLPKWYTNDPGGRSLTKKQERKARAKWECDLDRAILAFELMQEENNWGSPVGDYKRRFELIEDGLRIFARIYRSLWD